MDVLTPPQQIFLYETLTSIHNRICPLCSVQIYIAQYATGLFFPLVWCFSGGNPVVINPECLVSILLCEEMDDEESILLVGALCISRCGSFKCLGPHEDINPTDERKRWCVSIVAMDATCFVSSGHIIQYNKKNILRELNKAYCGFRHTITKLLLQICPRGHWKLGVWHVWGRETTIQ